MRVPSIACFLARSPLVLLLEFLASSGTRRWPLRTWCDARARAGMRLGGRPRQRRVSANDRRLLCHPARVFSRDRRLSPMGFMNCLASARLTWCAACDTAAHKHESSWYSGSVPCIPARKHRHRHGHPPYHHTTIQPHNHTKNNKQTDKKQQKNRPSNKTQPKKRIRKQAHKQTCLQANQRKHQQKDANEKACKINGQPNKQAYKQLHKKTRQA